jgi:hypothetical protein
MHWRAALREMLKDMADTGKGSSEREQKKQTHFDHGRCWFHRRHFVHYWKRTILMTGSSFSMR